MDSQTAKLIAAAAAGVSVGMLACHLFRPSWCGGGRSEEYSEPDQLKRHAAAVARKDRRVLDIDAFFDGGKYRGKRVLVTGTNRGLGLALATQLKECGAVVFATCRKPSPALSALGVHVIAGVDVCNDASMATLVEAVGSEKLDVVINNAGYFYGPFEPLTDLAFAEESKMIEICAIGMLRVTAALWNAGKIKTGGKVAMITSQGGSVAWREVQNPKGGDYGHHMSKAAANMMAKLVAQELKGQVVVAVLHPGFCRTDMTSKYGDEYDAGGAVEVSVGAKRVLHEIERASDRTSGKFINCEDGKRIPW